MSKLILNIVTLLIYLLIISCNDEYVHNGCDGNLSNEVYSGRFEANNIKSLGYIASDSRTLYPMPTKEQIDKVLIIKDADFLRAFEKSLKEHSKDQLTQGAAKSFHIFILFKNGKTACLFSSVKTRGAYLSPMFSFDSYGYFNNNLHNLIQSHHSK